MPAGQSKTQLLDHYQTKSVNTFYQIDGFSELPEDDVLCPDDDGDSFIVGQTNELMTTCPPVRVLVPVFGTDLSRLPYLLRKMATWIENTLLNDEG